LGFSLCKTPALTRPGFAAPQRSARCAARASAAPVTSAAATVEKLGRDIWNTTYYPKGVDHVPTEKTWYMIDAKGQRLGRMATLIATYLRGANKSTYTPSQDMGSYVVVINAEQVAVTGRKREQKLYVRHSTGRPGGHTVETFEALQKRIPTRIVEEAVWGMIPKEKLGRHLFTHLKCYKGGDHPHAAQQPADITHLISETCMP
jgi:large subunit ribosomal protein L13